jgi:hypothetical protein
MRINPAALSPFRINFIWQFAVPWRHPLHMAHSSPRNNMPTLAILLLDARWRPIGRLDRATSWQAIVAASFRLESRWLALEQGRADGGPPCPSPVDIALTRAVRRRLRPLGIGLADHVIHHPTASFSFRANGLL